MQRSDASAGSAYWPPTERRIRPPGMGALRTELIEAALECEADTDPATSRYLVLDRRRHAIPEDEFKELNWLGHRANADQLGDVIANRRRKLEAVGERPGTSDR